MEYLLKTRRGRCAKNNKRRTWRHQSVLLLLLVFHHSYYQLYREFSLSHSSQWNPRCWRRSPSRLIECIEFIYTTCYWHSYSKEIHSWCQRSLWDYSLSFIGILSNVRRSLSKQSSKSLLMENWRFISTQSLRSLDRSELQTWLFLLYNFAVGLRKNLVQHAAESIQRNKESWRWTYLQRAVLERWGAS